MIITFDSNIASYTAPIAHRCSATRFRWCVSECDCMTLPSPIGPFTLLVYDTPIALCTDVKLFKNIDCHFIYLDMNNKNESFKRIMNNLGTLKTKYVIISNMPLRSTRASYFLPTMNLPDFVIMNGIAAIINSYIKTKTLRHPDDIVSGNSTMRKLSANMLSSNLAKPQITNYQYDCVRYAC